MNLANIQNTDNYLVITRSSEPYIYDLKKIPSIVWYPIVVWIVAAYFMSKQPPPHCPVADYLIMLAMISPYWLPNIPRQIEGCLRQRILFDKTVRKIYLNGKFWAEFKNVTAVQVLTKPGIMVYRRFRLVLTTDLGAELRIVDTPMWADWSMVERYMGESYLDKQKFKSTDYFKASGLLWRPYEKGMTGYDRNDPWIKDIFDLGALITNEINSSRIQDNLAG